MEGDTQLQDLPFECLQQIIANLAAGDIVSLMLVSSSLRAVAGSEVVWKELAWKDFSIHDVSSPATPVVAACDDDAVSDATRRGRRWRRLYGAVRSQLADRSHVLRMHGIFTDGGVDENQMENWVVGHDRTAGRVHRENPGVRGRA